MVAVNYDWDELEDNIDEEYSDAGNTIAEHTNEPYVYGELLSQRRNGESRFHCFDALGSTLAVTDSAGMVTETTAYTAFGELTEHTGGAINPFGYVGRKGYYKSAAIVETSVRRRQLSQHLARWTSSDPLEHILHANGYAYVLNEPTLDSDPSGLAPPPQWKRKLDLVAKEKAGGNPTGLRDTLPGYTIWILHEVPTNPKKREQLWQAAKCNITRITSDCTLEEDEEHYILDIATIGKRLEIEDQLGYHLETESLPCFVNETCRFRTGFGPFSDTEQAGLEVEEGPYKYRMGKIEAQRVEWSTSYVYINMGACRRCCPSMLSQFLKAVGSGFPRFMESLVVEEVGAWTYFVW